MPYPIAEMAFHAANWYIWTYKKRINHSRFTMTIQSDCVITVPRQQRGMWLMSWHPVERPSQCKELGMMSWWERTGRVRQKWDGMNVRNLNWRKRRRCSKPVWQETLQVWIGEKGEKHGEVLQGRLWQQNEQDGEEHGTGEEKGSQPTAANSFCDFRWRRWQLHMAQHQEVTPRCQFPER